MNDTKNLMGLNLSVDNDLIADAGRETIISCIAGGLSHKEEIIKEFVKASLTERVLVEDGSKPRGYSSEKTCSRMEYAVRREIMQLTREEIASMIEEQKPVLRELVRKEFQKKQTQEKFVSMFLDSLSMDVQNCYKTKININFERIENN